MTLSSAQHLASLLLVNTVTVLCQHTSPQPPPSLEENGTEDSSLLYSFSQFNVARNWTGANTTQEAGDTVSTVLGNPAQFLVLQFASTVIVTSLQVRTNLKQSFNLKRVSQVLACFVMNYLFMKQKNVM